MEPRVLTTGPCQESETKPARAPRLGGPPKRVRSPAGLQTKAKAAGPPRLSGKAGQSGGSFTYNFCRAYGVIDKPCSVDTPAHPGAGKEEALPSPCSRGGAAMRLRKRQWYDAETRSPLPRGRPAVEVRSPSQLTPAQPRPHNRGGEDGCMSLVSADKGQAGD